MLRKAVQSARLEYKNWKQEVYRFLRRYRATPHISTGKTPADIIFLRRHYRTKLPEIKPTIDDKEERDKGSQAKQKGYADRCKHVKISNFNLGDSVLVKQKKINKSTPT